MTATADRNTQQRAADSVSIPVAAGVVIFAGTIVSLNAAGFAVPGSDTAGHKGAYGRAEAHVDNSAGSAGDVSVTVQRGCFKWANSTEHAIDRSHVGSPCYIEDDSTVASTSDQGIVAGIVVDLEEDGVWVDTRYHLHTLSTPADGSVAVGKLANDVADQILGAPSVTVENSDVPDGNAEITIQAKDAQGNNLAARCLVRVWIDDEAYGAPADLGALSATTGTLLSEEEDDAVATVATDATGKAVLVLNTASDGNVHVMAAVIGLVGTGNAAISGNA